METIRTVITKSFHLELSEDEALFLKDLLRNYLGSDLEPKFHKVHREHLFKLLSKEDIVENVRPS